MSCIELVDTRRVEASSLYNADLAPVPLSKRTWTTYNYAALWISMAHCIPTYMLASGLLASGMNWSQALITILLGNTIVLIRSSPGRATARSGRTFLRSCARSSPVAGSASRRGSAGRRCMCSSHRSFRRGPRCLAARLAAIR